MKELMSVSKAAIKIDNKIIFQNLNFIIKQNKINVLVGENGSGKSMCLDVLGGISQFSVGYTAPEITSLSKIYMSQRLTMPYLLKVKEALHYLGCLLNPKIKTWNTSDFISRLHPEVNLIFEQVQNQRASLCSVGENRLLLINLFLISGEGKFIILDEPTAGLSVSSRKIFRELLNKRNTNTTILYSTHLNDDIHQADHIIKIPKH